MGRENVLDADLTDRDRAGVDCGDAGPVVGGEIERRVLDEAAGGNSFDMGRTARIQRLDPQLTTGGDTRRVAEEEVIAFLGQREGVEGEARVGRDRERERRVGDTDACVGLGRESWRTARREEQAVAEQGRRAEQADYGVIVGNVERRRAECLCRRMCPADAERDDTQRQQLARKLHKGTSIAICPVSDDPA